MVLPPTYTQIATYLTMNCLIKKMYLSVVWIKCNYHRIFRLLAFTVLPAALETAPLKAALFLSYILYSIAAIVRVTLIAITIRPRIPSPVS